jgi:hypothetical protein
MGVTGEALAKVSGRDSVVCDCLLTHMLPAVELSL